MAGNGDRSCPRSTVWLASGALNSGCDLGRRLKQHSQFLFVVDQPEPIGALPIAVAQAESALVCYLPSLTMRRIADLHAGEAKTDARDAAIIA